MLKNPSEFKKKFTGGGIKSIKYKLLIFNGVKSSFKPASPEGHKVLFSGKYQMSSKQKFMKTGTCIYSLWQIWFLWHG